MDLTTLISNWLMKSVTLNNPSVHWMKVVGAKLIQWTSPTRHYSSS